MGIKYMSDIERLKQAVYYLEEEQRKLRAIVSQLVAEVLKPREVNYHYPYPPAIFYCPQTPQWQSPEFPKTTLPPIQG